MSRRTAFATLVALVLLAPLAGAQEHDHDHGPPAVEQNYLQDTNRELARELVMQDFRGRMKPLDTHAREIAMKVTKREHFEGWEPIDMYLSWLTNPQHWYRQEVVAVRHPGVKDLLGVSHDVKWVSAASLIRDNSYILSDAVREALRTPDVRRSKMQRKLLKFDERFNIYWNVLNGGGLRVYPLPGDANNTWLDFSEVEERSFPEKGRFEEIHSALAGGLRAGDNARIRQGLTGVYDLQHEYGAAVLPSDTARKAELWLNDAHPFRNVTMGYLAAFALLMIAFFWSLWKRGGAPFAWKHPLFLLGNLVFWASTLYHTVAFALRWVASGRAPLSNGYESLIFIALATAVAGIIFEIRDRRGSSSGVAALLTTLILSVAMLSTFDPAIGPLVPVLASYWLNIHVTIITGSYGFLGLGSLLGGLTLLLLLFKGPNREHIHEAIQKLDKLHFRVLVTGIGLLSVGTLLGGVWANESWGRYWGWDPKETWSLVTILVYAIVIHFRWIPALNRPWVLAAGGYIAILSVVMTYFGVNYFLSGLHSYASGDAAKVPDWTYVVVGLMLALIAASWLVDRFRRWQE